MIREPALRAGRAAQPHRLADLRHRRLRGRRAPGGRAARPGRARRPASCSPSSNLGGGFGIAYLAEDDPVDARATSPRGCARSSPPSARRWACRCRGWRSSPAGRSPGPGTVTLYEIGTIKPVRLDGGCRHAGAQLRLGRRRDERQHPHRPLRRRATPACWPTAAPTPRRRCAGSSASTARAATSLVRDLWLPADVAARRPARGGRTGAYCWSMASNYNYLLKPPVVAVRDGVATEIVAAADTVRRVRPRRRPRRRARAVGAARPSPPSEPARE